MKITGKELQDRFYSDPNVPDLLKKNVSEAIARGELNKNNFDDVVTKVYKPYMKIASSVDKKTDEATTEKEKILQRWAENIGTDVKTLTSVSKEQPKQVETPEQGFFSSIGSEIGTSVSQRGQALAGNLAKIVEGGKSDIRNLGRTVSGEGNLIDKITKTKDILKQGAQRTAGQAIGAAGNIVGSVTDVALSPVTVGLKKTDELLKGVPSAAIGTVGSFVDKTTGLSEKLQKFVAENPNAAEAIKGGLEIGPLKGAKLVKEGVEKGVKTAAIKAAEKETNKLNQILQPSTKETVMFEEGGKIGLTKSQKGLLENVGTLKGINNIEEGVKALAKKSDEIINKRNNLVKEKYKGDEYRIGGDDVKISVGNTQISGKEMISEMIDTVVNDLSSGGGVLSKEIKDKIKLLNNTKDVVNRGAKINQQGYLTLKRMAQDIIYRDSKDITKSDALKDKFKNLNSKIQEFSDAVVPKDVRDLEKQFERISSTKMDFMKNVQTLKGAGKEFGEGTLEKAWNLAKSVATRNVSIEPNRLKNIEKLDNRIGKLINELDKKPTVVKKAASTIINSINKKTVGGASLITAIEAARSKLEELKRNSEQK